MSFGYQTQTSPRTIHQRIRVNAVVACAGFAIALSTSVSHAQQSNQPGNNNSVHSNGHTSASNDLNGSKLLKPKLGKDGATEYLVEHPTWRESKAVRVLDPNRPHLNIEKTIFSRIIVHVDNETVLQNAIKTVGHALGTNRPGSHTYESLLNDPKTFVIEANSVEDAIRFANEISKLDGIHWAEVDHQGQVENKAITSDPLSPFQWHILNVEPGFAGNDHNIDLVYDRGFTGSGVVVGILEAFANSFYHVDEFGTTFIHPDLANQLNTNLSLDTDPFNVTYSHGVSVAGLVSSTADNGLAGAGVAYNAQLASLRNGSQIDSSTSFGHKLADIDIVNNSWGPINESFPGNNTGKYLIAPGSDDYEIDIPQVTHAGLSRTNLIGIDQGIRLGRARKGRIFVFSAGNGSHFQGFARLALGNAISLPGFGVPTGVDMNDAPTWDIPSYGYLDITGTSTTDADFDGVPDVFLMNGATTGLAPSGDPTALGWRWSGHLGDRLNYNEMASNARTLAIASVGISNARSGYSTTGCGILAGAYSQDSVMNAEFNAPLNSWDSIFPTQGLTTLSQFGSIFDAGACDAIYPGTNFTSDLFNGSATTCQFNGTSAAAPVAAGVMALMLEANPSLTLRDVQQIIQQTSTVVNYNPTNSYWPSVILGLGATDPDDGTPPTPTFWTTNRAGVRHSDEYGFGIIDADAAVAAAMTWPGVGQLHVLDSGLVSAGDDGFFDDGMIEDATFVQSGIISENLETNVLVPGARSSFFLTCVRENMVIEGVELTVTIEGDGAGDLMIALQGPYGTISPLALPRGDSNGLNENAYFDYTFTTYKHWGELSGGDWTLIVQDFRPDVESPEGTVADDPVPPPPVPAEANGVEQVTYLGAFGLPGNPDHTEKTLVSYRLKIFGTDHGDEIYDGCPILTTSCPADLDGNGIVDVTDLQIYISWYIEGNALADITGDGTINYTDLVFYRGIWQPGFCSSSSNPFGGGRPRPGGSGLGDNDPIIHPI